MSVQVVAPVYVGTGCVCVQLTRWHLWGAVNMVEGAACGRIQPWVFGLNQYRRVWCLHCIGTYTRLHQNGTAAHTATAHACQQELRNERIA